MNVNSELQKEIEQVFAEAELLYSADEVDAAINKMAREISQALKDKNPVVLCLMIGAVIPVGKLLPKLQFPLQLEYVHASRYRGETSGGDIDWIKRPALDLQGRVVLIIDDILDEGITLAAIIDECHKLGASDIYTAVLVDKQIEHGKNIQKADFTGLTVPDRYVFGCGMDYKSYLRNYPGIYAVKDR